ncbi:MAG: carboxymuconolactone decarboxylase family protein [Rhodospirillales bacterium]|nr:carboxymuconolactone decarboxylase family protein [Rhodospirillales bacterium]
MHTQRLDPQIIPEGYKALAGVERYLAQCGLEKSLVELVKLRASMINGCAFCVDMHTKDARKGGETEQRLSLVSAWAESAAFTARERAALAWTDCLTRIATEGAPDATYEALRAHFSETEIANLTTLIGMINLWNRLAIAVRRQHPVAVRAAAA